MAKFKVGDKVRVVKQSPRSVATGKKNFIDKIFTIVSVSPINGDKYPYYLEQTGYYWCDVELELAEFTKADLKDGMVVEIKGDRKEKRFMVLGDKVRGYNEFMRLEAFDDDLTHTSGSDLLTIVKVYNSTASTLGSYLNSAYLKLLWERPKEEPVKEMTIEDIEKLVGCKVKVVGSEGK